MAEPFIPSVQFSTTALFAYYGLSFCHCGVSGDSLEWNQARLLPEMQQHQTEGHFPSVVPGNFFVGELVLQ